jgi:hypothetical protein
MKTPCAKLVPLLNVVRTLNGVGNSTLTRKLEKMLPAICAEIRRKARIGDMARHSSIANVTAGLNKPPEIRKKTHTLTIKLKLKTSAMYKRTLGENPVASPVVVFEPSLEPMLATCVPEKAKKRNMVVPTNSPTKATKWFFAFEPIQIIQGRRMTSSVDGGARGGSLPLLPPPPGRMGGRRGPYSSSLP